MTHLESTLRIGRWIGLLLLCPALWGCRTSRVTRANYDQIQDGMSIAQVEGILGPGYDQGGGARPIFRLLPGATQVVQSKIWLDGSRSITVSFIDGQVTSKSESGL